jgi:hypothetical protein
MATRRWPDSTRIGAGGTIGVASRSFVSVAGAGASYATTGGATRWTVRSAVARRVQLELQRGPAKADPDGDSL